MSSGIADPRWNNADVTAPDPDVAAIEAWYRDRDVPWGLRVPVEWTVALGRQLFTKRAFGFVRRRDHEPDGTNARVRRSDDLEAFVAAESAAFGDGAALIRRWIEPTFHDGAFGYWIAEQDGSIVAVATTIRSDGDAGPATMISGVARVPDASGTRHERGGRRDPRACICSHLLATAPAGTLVHAYAASDHEAALWSGLGFGEVPGFVIRVVREN